MKDIHIICNVLKGHSSYSADRVGKIFVNHFHGNADGLKNLGALVRLNGGNSHFRRNLHNAVKHGKVIIFYRRIVILVKHPGLNQVFDGFVSQVRVYGAGPIA